MKDREKEIREFIEVHDDDDTIYIREVKNLLSTIDGLRKKERVLYDIHDALGIKWGEDPYAKIKQFQAALVEKSDMLASERVRHRVKIQGRDKQIAELQKEIERLTAIDKAKVFVAKDADAQLIEELHNIESKNCELQKEIESLRKELEEGKK